MATLIDSLVGEYRVLRQLGEGGMGQVFEAVHPVIGKHVAVKVLRLELAKDEQLVRRFIEEARAVTAIKHHSIVDVFGFGTLPDGRLYLVMDLLEGEPFSSYLRNEGPLEPEVARRWLLELFDAVAAAHQAGVVHRDLKPSNLFLVGASGEKRLKVLDFGISRREARDEALTRPNVLLGSPAYIAPEQIRGEATQASDLYSIGCIAWAMLAGRTLFRGEVLDVLNQHLLTPAPPPSSVVPSVPPDLDDFVLWLLEKEPDDRPASALAARDALAALSLERDAAFRSARPTRSGERTIVATPARRSITETAPPLANEARSPALSPRASAPSGPRRTETAPATPAPDVVARTGARGTETAPAIPMRATDAALETVESPRATAPETPAATLGDEDVSQGLVTPGRKRLVVGVALLASIAGVVALVALSPSTSGPTPSAEFAAPSSPREPSPTLVTAPTAELIAPTTAPGPNPTPPPVEPPLAVKPSPTTSPTRDPRVPAKPPIERPTTTRPATRPAERAPPSTPDSPAGDRLARTATQAELEARLAGDEAALKAGRARGGKNAGLLLEDARARLGAPLSADERVNLQSFLDEWEQRYLPR